MKIRSIIGLVFGLVVALCCMSAPKAFADVNDFTIHGFDAKYRLTNADKQGQLQITENIDLEFTDNNHGILRALPLTYKKHQLQLDVTGVNSKSGAPSMYTTYQQNGNTVLKIGDPNRTVTGKQQYAIGYTMRNVISFYDAHDELYWDINGDQWDQPFNQVSLRLALPEGARLSNTRPVCYTGSFGSTNADCTVAYDKSAHQLTVATTRALQARQTLSVVVGFEKGYFTPSSWHETLGEYAWQLGALITPIALLGGTTGILWYRRGRDAKGRGVIVPQYDAPDGLPPLLAGTVIDFRTETRDFTAAIIGLAIRRHITIIEEKKVRRLGRDTLAYRLRLERSDTTELTAHEAEILKGLFVTFTVGQEVDLSTRKFALASTAQKLQRQVQEQLVTEGYFGGKFALGLWLRYIVVVFLAMGLAAVVFAIAGVWGWFAGGAVVGTGVAIIFLALLPNRTAKGVAAKEHLFGLKMYLEVAEADRLKKLQSPDAAYSGRREPKHTVELFERLLPYAIVLGVEKQWAKQFEGIYRTAPAWYNGSTAAAFSAGYLASSLGSGVASAVGTTFSSPSNSSGSGFSGGGSGSGGGGGGGGGW